MNRTSLTLASAAVIAAAVGYFLLQLTLPFVVAGACLASLWLWSNHFDLSKPAPALGTPEWFISTASIAAAGAAIYGIISGSAWVDPLIWTLGSALAGCVGGYLLRLIQAR